MGWEVEPEGYIYNLYIHISATSTSKDTNESLSQFPSTVPKGQIIDRVSKLQIKMCTVILTR